MAEKKKKLSQIEFREKLIKDRATKLAKDAKKQGITPEQLLKKKRDTYLGVVGGAASLALPFGAIARGATALFKGIGGASKIVKKAKDAAKSLKTSKTPKKGTGAKLKPRNQEQAKIKKRLEKKKTPTKQTKKVDTKKTDTKKTGSSSIVPKAIGAGGAAAILTTIIAKKKDGSAKAKGNRDMKGGRRDPNFGMGMVDSFSKSKVRRKDNMEGGTAPIADKKKKRDVSQGSTMAKTPKKAKPITAGGNVGFGPKGNIFPSNAAERKKLMDKFGGTGSAAAKAAAKGRQGNLKKVSRT